MTCEHWGVYLRFGSGLEHVLVSYLEKTAAWNIEHAVKLALEFVGRSDVQVTHRQHAPQTDASGMNYRNRGNCTHHGLSPRQSEPLVVEGQNLNAMAEEFGVSVNTLFSVLMGVLVDDVLEARIRAYLTTHPPYSDAAFHAPLSTPLTYD